MASRRSLSGVRGGLGKLNPLNMSSHAAKLSRLAESISWSEWCTYKVEKFLSVSNKALFYILLCVLVYLSLVLGFTWYWLHSEDEDLEDSDKTFAMSLFIAFQVICSGGFTREAKTVGAVIVYATMLVAGVIVFALLIGMITEAFETMLVLIRSGKLKAVETDHTLVLGWNESTARLICQLSFCRRQFQQMNESWDKKIFWWRRVKPTTSVAQGVIVILCNSLSKEQMEQMLQTAFMERGIQRKRTRLGYHVVCRVGDPTSVESLQYVGAQRARAIIVQHSDGMEFTESEGRMIRTLMSLRKVLHTCETQPPWDDLRIVVEMARPSEVVEAARFAGGGRKSTLVYLQQVNVFLNHLLFSTLGQPGLADVRMELMCFEGASFKFRKASELKLGGCTVGEASLIWENAVFVGVQRDSTRDDSSGLLPNIGITIDPNDTVIFFCQWSLPTVRDQTAERRNSTAVASAPSRPGGANLNGKTEINGTTERRVLICGWRPGWNKPEELIRVLHEILHGVSSRLFIHFVCDMKEEDFHALMKRAQKVALGSASPEKDRINEKEGSKPGEPAWTFNRTCEIAHTFWDEVHFEELRGVVAKRQFHEAVVIPRSPEDGMASELDKRDNWLLSVMLMIKRLQTEANQKPMHIVAENALDSTSKLTAVLPGQEEQMAPDFVNMLAIRARALCQVAAYPRMSSVIEDLCSRQRGTPCVMLVPSGIFNLDGHHVSFRQATERVLEHQPPQSEGGSFGSNDVVLGVRTADGVLTMPPKQSDMHFYKEGDALVIVTRRVTSRREYEDMIQRHCLHEPPSADGAKARWAPRSSRPRGPPAAKLGSE